MGEGATRFGGGAVRVLILEDIPATRDWLMRAAGAAFAGAEITTLGSLAEARWWLAALILDASPLVALVDIGLPDGSGITFIGELCAAVASATVVVTTIYDDDAHLLEAMAAGASGYLLKDREVEEIARRLAGIVRGEVAISPSIARRILQLFRNQTILLGTAPAEPVPLTARETDVLRMIGRGLKVSETAGALGLSELTVSSYVKAIYRKLDIFLARGGGARGGAARTGLNASPHDWNSFPNDHPAFHHPLHIPDTPRGCASDRPPPR